MHLIKTLFALASISAMATTAAEIDSRAAQSVASSSLITLRKLAVGTNSYVTGFASAEEAKAAVLGQPIRTYLVRLDDLRGYQAGRDAEPLLKPLDKLIFPVLVAEQVRSSVIVEKVHDQWKATSFGGPILVKAMTKSLRESSSVTKVPVESYFVVDISALNAHFIAYRAANKVTLISIFDDSKLKLKAGEALPAEQVFTNLVPIANRYNGLPL